MHDEFYAQVQEKYQSRDFAALFETLLSIAEIIGRDEALALLERCAIEKRRAWLEANLDLLDRTENPVVDGYRAFYEVYLGVSAPVDGEIAEQDDTHMVMRWWNACPLLDVCGAMGLETREICWKTYEKPVQAFLSKINPCLKFSRNYARIRPHTPYCEEVITLEE